MQCPHLHPSPVGTEKKPLVSSPGEGGVSTLLTLSSQDAQHATPSGMPLQGFASQASPALYMVMSTCILLTPATTKSCSTSMPPNTGFTVAFSVALACCGLRAFVSN